MKLYKDKLVQIHLFGATGSDYSRPFPVAASPFAALLGYLFLLTCFVTCANVSLLRSQTGEDDSKKKKKKEKKDD